MNRFTGLLLRGCRRFLIKPRALYYRVFKPRLYCRALSGKSGFNISVNADMSVSCTCQDYDGSGRLGDLSTQTLQEIFDGPVARRFRETLAQGHAAIKVCFYCEELRHTSRGRSKHYLTHYTVPTFGIQVENTAGCNLDCLLCDRDRHKRLLKRPQMSLADVERVAETINTCGIKKMAFFKLGEPFLSPRVRDELTVLRQKNPGLFIWTSTNGMLLKTEDKREAALLMDNVVFSIDGESNQTLTKYQRGGSFDLAYRNMADLVVSRNARGKTRPIIEWKYVLFDWNDGRDQIDRAIQLAKEADVDWLTFFPGSVEGVGRRYEHYWTHYVSTVGVPLRERGVIYGWRICFHQPSVAPRGEGGPEDA